MIKRVAALTCCVSLVHVSIAGADDAAASGPAPLTVAAVKAAPQPGPIRSASLNRDAVMTFIGDAKSERQDTEGDRGSWVERHAVWTGAIAGFSAGFALTYVATHDSDKGELLKVMSPGAGALFWGGVCAGVGALAGWGIGRNRDED